jgi:hypothetical protein
MKYEHWRADLFGHPEDSDPVMIDLMEETNNLSESELLDFIDRALQDPDIHTMYSPIQIGNGLSIIFSNDCSDLPFCFIESKRKPQNELRKIEAIKNLRFLYSNYFAKYCREPIEKIGHFSDLNSMNYICHMFWDIFVLYPGNATDAMVEAGIGVMKESLQLENDNCIVSILHGLGHWVPDTDLAAPVIDQWLLSPSTKNEVIIEYANQARTGYIQ